MWVAAFAIGLLRIASLGSAKPVDQVVVNLQQEQVVPESFNEGARHNHQNEASLSEFSASAKGGLMRREFAAEGKEVDSEMEETVSPEEATDRRKEIKNKAKLMFKEMDVDTDGSLSFAELKDIHGRGAELEKFHDMLLGLNMDNHGSLDWKEFRKAMYRFYNVSSWTDHQHHHKSDGAHHVLAHPHRSALLEESQNVPTRESPAHLDAGEDHEHGHSLSTSKGQGTQYHEKREGYAEFIDSSGKVHLTTKTKTHTEHNKVSCGGHLADMCELCTTTAADGTTTTDHGPEWCNGDCVYSSGACLPAGTAVADAEAETQGYGTTAIPDLLNPALTAQDNRTIQRAAEAAIREENLEAAERERQAEEDIKEGKFNWKKFWLIVVIVTSVILGICAICSIVAVVILFRGGEKKPPAVDDAATDAGSASSGADDDDPGVPEM